MNLLFEKPTNFKSLKEFEQVLSKYKTVKPNQIKDGFLYSFDYAYAEDEVDFETLRFYDSFPLSLIFTVKDSNHFFGINFHRAPLLTRNWLISRLKSLNPVQFSKAGTNKIKVNYQTLKSLMARAPYLVRQYRNDRASNIKVIPNKDWNEVVKYQPNTFYSASFVQMVNKYNEYPIDKKKKQKKGLKESFGFDFESFNISKTIPSPTKNIRNLLNELNHEEINPYPVF